MAPLTLLFAAAVAAATATATPVNPPDTSLSTIPVAYYGANWNRTQTNIDGLAKFQMVTLMQEDGHCWATCCPHASDPGHSSQCGPLHNASAIPGCDASCAQHAAQSDIFAAVKSSAKSQSRRAPHCVLYMNSVYLWPFDAANTLGSAVQLLDVHGAPHMESCDPGIFPSYFWDFGRKRAQQAWLDIIRTNILGKSGSADGLYNDCDTQNPIICSTSDPNNNTCTARRNGKAESLNEEVTRAQRDAYQAGKNATMLLASKMVDSAGGTFYNKNSAAGGKKPPNFGGGNLQYLKIGHHEGSAWDASGFFADVAKIRENYDYIVVGSANGFSSPKTETLPQNQDLTSGRSLKTCPTNTVVAQFLLGVEPGMYLGCNAWDKRFDRELGAPKGKAILNNATQTWHRSFASGVRVTWDVKADTGAVIWPTQ